MNAVYYGMTRREIIRASACAAIYLIMRTGMIHSLNRVYASESASLPLPVSQVPTIAEFLSLSYSDYWNTLPEEVQAALQLAPSEGRGKGEGLWQDAATVGLDAWIQLKSKRNQISYAAGYSTNKNCSLLAACVTCLKHGSICCCKVYSGTGTCINCSDTIPINESGIYRVVITGYPVEVPEGYGVSYSQAQAGIKVHARS